MPSAVRVLASFPSSIAAISPVSPMIAAAGPCSREESPRMCIYVSSFIFYWSARHQQSEFIKTEENLGSAQTPNERKESTKSINHEEDKAPVLASAIRAGPAAEDAAASDKRATGFSRLRPSSNRQAIESQAHSIDPPAGCNQIAGNHAVTCATAGADSTRAAASEAPRSRHHIESPPSRQAPRETQLRYRPPSSPSPARQRHLPHTPTRFQPAASQAPISYRQGCARPEILSDRVFAFRGNVRGVAVCRAHFRRSIPARLA